MSRDIFHDREKAEEAAYFHKQDAMLLEKLRQRAKLSEIAEALAEKLQVDDRTLLERIKMLGVTLDIGAAFILSPLIEIAWADGSVTQAERDAVVRIAKNRGIMPDSADMNQLLQWLEKRPPDGVFELAVKAIKVGISVLSPGEADQRVKQMLNACEEVARAEGGGLQKLLLSLPGPTSREERAVLKEIAKRLSA